MLSQRKHSGDEEQERVSPSHVPTPRRSWREWRPSPYVLTSGFRLGVQAVSFLSMMLGVRELPPDIFGAFSAAWAILTVCGAILYNGLYQHVLRVHDLESAGSTTFGLLLLQGFVLALLLIVLTQLPAVTTNALVYHSLWMFAPLPVLMSFLAWNEALLVRQQRLGTLSAIQFCCELVGSLALIIGTRLGLQLWALLLWRIAPTVCGALTLPFATGSFTWPRIARAHVRSALSIAMPLQGTALLAAAAQYSGDFFLVGHFNTATSAAYRVANRISSTATTMFIEPMRPITWAVMSQASREGNASRMRAELEEQLSLLALLSWPVLLTLAVFNERLLAAFTRYDWSAAAPLLGILAVARMADVIASFSPPALVCTGRAKLSATIGSIATVVGLAGVALVSPHGASAVAIWQCGYGVVMGAVQSELAVRALGLSRRRLARALAPALGTAICCIGAGELCYRLLSASPPVRLIASLGTLAVVAALSFYFLFRRGLVTLPRAAARAAPAE